MGVTLMKFKKIDDISLAGILVDTKSFLAKQGFTLAVAVKKHEGFIGGSLIGYSIPLAAGQYAPHSPIEALVTGAATVGGGLLFDTLHNKEINIGNKTFGALNTVQFAGLVRMTVWAIAATKGLINNDIPWVAASALSLSAGAINMVHGKKFGNNQPPKIENGKKFFDVKEIINNFSKNPARTGFFLLASACTILTVDGVSDLFKKTVDTNTIYKLLNIIPGAASAYTAFKIPEPVNNLADSKHENLFNRCLENTSTFFKKFSKDPQKLTLGIASFRASINLLSGYVEFLANIFENKILSTYLRERANKSGEVIAK
jgi:hypothetical protein